MRTDHEWTEPAIQTMGSACVQKANAAIDEAHHQGAVSAIAATFLLAGATLATSALIPRRDDDNKELPVTGRLDFYGAAATFVIASIAAYWTLDDRNEAVRLARTARRVQEAANAKIVYASTLPDNDPRRRDQVAEALLLWATCPQ